MSWLQALSSQQKYGEADQDNKNWKTKKNEVLDPSKPLKLRELLC